MIERKQKVLALISLFLVLPVGFILLLAWSHDTQKMRSLGKRCFMLSVLPYLVLLVIGITNLYISPIR